VANVYNGNDAYSLEYPIRNGNITMSSCSMIQTNTNELYNGVPDFRPLRQKNGCISKDVSSVVKRRVSKLA